MDVVLERSDTRARRATSRETSYIRLEVSVVLDAISRAVWENIRSATAPSGDGRRAEWASVLPSIDFLAARRAQGALGALRLACPVRAENVHELADIVDFASQCGCDALVFSMKSTGDSPMHEEHLQHLAFLETLRNPCFAHPVVALGELASCRRRALLCTLPSDLLGGSPHVDEWHAAITQAASQGDLHAAIALGAAARWRLPFDARLRMLEGTVLQTAGLVREAAWRYQEVLAREPGHAVAQSLLASTSPELLAQA